jgi:hypothetical protein
LILEQLGKNEGLTQNIQIKVIVFDVMYSGKQNGNSQDSYEV